MTETARPDSLTATGGAIGRSRPATGVWAWAGTVAGVLLGLVLLYSAWGKALDPHGTGEIYARRGLLPAALATAVIVAAVALEAFLGAALLVNLRRRPVLVAATLLMLAFFGLSLYEYFVPAKDAGSCGCFGNLVVRTPGQAALGDGVFVVLALLAWIGRPRGGRSAVWQRAVPATVAILAAGLAIAAPRLPLDHVATRLLPGASVRALHIDEVIPELRTGRSLVLLIDRADDRTRQDVARINQELALKVGPVRVFGLAEDNEALATEFTWTAAPAFEVRSAPYMTLKPLYRTLPRAFLVADGTVVRVWDGIPDTPTLRALSTGQTP